MTPLKAVRCPEAATDLSDLNAYDTRPTLTRLPAQKRTMALVHIFMLFAGVLAVGTAAGTLVRLYL